MARWCYSRFLILPLYTCAQGRFEQLLHLRRLNMSSFLSRHCGTKSVQTTAWPELPRGQGALEQDDGE